MSVDDKGRSQEALRAEHFLASEENKTGLTRISQPSWSTTCEFAEAYAQHVRNREFAPLRQQVEELRSNNDSLRLTNDKRSTRIAQLEQQLDKLATEFESWLLRYESGELDEQEMAALRQQVEESEQITNDVYEDYQDAVKRLHATEYRIAILEKALMDIGNRIGAPTMTYSPSIERAELAQRVPEISKIVREALERTAAKEA